MWVRVHIPAGASTAAQLFSTVLVVLGLSCGAAYVWMCTDQFVYQSAQQQYLPSALPSKGVEHSHNGSPAPTTLSQPAGRTRRWVSWIGPDPAVIGRLEIPRLDINVIIREGTDTQTLRRAVGHMPSTALPGHAGNFVIAGHRDTFFRPLRGISRGDEIRAVTRSHVYLYRVYELRVVPADYTEVLQPTQRPECTLVTCFPFDYFGPAPRRLIVHAHLVERLPQ